MRDGLAPLSFAQIYRADVSVAHRIIGGEFGNLLKLRERFCIVSKLKVGLAERDVIQPIVGVGGDRVLIGGNGFVTLTAGDVGVTQAAIRFIGVRSQLQSAFQFGNRLGILTRGAGAVAGGSV